MELSEKIGQLLEEKYSTDEAFADCFTVEIEVKAGPKLAVFADSDSGMTFEKCQKLSRYLESYIDTNGWLGEKYTIEVSSPGIGRSLKFKRQYLKNIGRTLEISLQDKTKETGILLSSDDVQIVIKQTITERDEKKKKKVYDIEKPIPFEQIDKSIVKVTF